MCSFIFTNKPIADLEAANFFTRLRGPDHTSEIHKGSYTFIHNLLSITGDFTPQPTISDDHRVFCLFNGEIYNFKSFGDFASDSLCLIPLYLAHGTDFVRFLDGEFAIVLVDFTKRQVLCTTDAFATKPLWLSAQGDHFGAASYRSALSCIGFRQVDKVAANTTIVYDMTDWRVIDRRSVFEFDITHQVKTDFDDWQLAFQDSIRKRAVSNVREKIFIGLSSGYDSGAIACELARQRVRFKIYSVLGRENREILAGRHERLKTTADIELLDITEDLRAKAHAYIEKHVEPFNYRICSMTSDYNEFHLRLHDDHGANSLSHVAACAKRDKHKIYLSGQGADEIFSDYGYQGKKIYPHSNFGGLFPKDLSAIFPWPSFYESSMVSYLAKEEHVAGAYGLEARYPYLDPKVIQEFLWLDHRLKNKWYKSVLHHYLTRNDFPFAMQKIGF